MKEAGLRAKQVAKESSRILINKSIMGSGKTPMRKDKENSNP